MAKLQKSTKLYAHPFCKGYWADAFAEMKDTKMLVFAALIVALRVALKTIIRIPLGPSLDITPAFLANALGAMVYGPVVGALGAVVSDLLGVLLVVPEIRARLQPLQLGEAPAAFVDADVGGHLVDGNPQLFNALADLLGLQQFLFHFFCHTTSRKHIHYTTNRASCTRGREYVKMLSIHSP